MSPLLPNQIRVQRLVRLGKAQLAFAALMNGNAVLTLVIGSAVMPERVTAIALAVSMMSVVSLLVLAEVSGTLTRIFRNV